MPGTYEMFFKVEVNGEAYVCLPFSLDEAKGYGPQPWFKITKKDISGIGVLTVLHRIINPELIHKLNALVDGETKESTEPVLKEEFYDVHQ